MNGQVERSSLGLYVLASYNEATPNELDLICNGCGSAQAKFDFVPDSIYGLSISDACNPHDWAYHKGTTWQDKFSADLCFLCNLLILITRKAGYLRIPRYYRALHYWMAVHEKGEDAFWSGKARIVDGRKERR